MTDWTPDTEYVRNRYVTIVRNAFIGSTSEHEAEFDRWLHTIRTEARQHGYAERLADEAAGIGAGNDWFRGIQADAWCRGYAAGAADDFSDQPHGARNPYRGDDDMLPESERKTVELPGEDEG